MKPPPDGPFETFHPNGDLATRGHYLDGKYDGTISRFVSNAPGGEPLRSCCVPPGSSELRAEYRAGLLLRETFLDQQGRPLASDGTPWPERPLGVPISANFDEASGRYCEREGGFFSPTRLRYYDRQGRPEEELETTNGRISLRRSFGPDGRVVDEWGLDGGKPHGAYRRCFDAATTPYADARIREERGLLEHSEGSGTARLLDEHGELVRSIEHGAPLVGGTSALVSGEEPAQVTANALAGLVEELVRQRRPREALAIAARALAHDRDVAAFRRLLARDAAALRPELAVERAERAADAKERTASRLLDELIGGGEPALVLRALAASIPPASPAALDYAEASILLAPDAGVTRVTRGLLRIEHGDREGALDDARAVAEHSAPAAEFLREYARVLFREFRFEPLDEPPAASTEELPALVLEQPLEAVRRTLGLYATRLLRVRTELTRRFPAAPAWLPPDTTALLASGPLELAHFVARIEDETEAGVEVSEVPVDETLAVERLSARELLSSAHADWAALCWLCWCAGLDRVARPEALEPREHFAEAANRATVRCFWAHDRLKTEGLVALARKLRPFSWQGIPIQSLPRLFTQIAAAEYLEVRAVFLWLLFPANVSPFQADLRNV